MARAVTDRACPNSQCAMFDKIGKGNDDHTRLGVARRPLKQLWCLSNGVHSGRTAPARREDGRG